MGIKMSEAFDSAKNKWSAEGYAKGKGSEPLFCLYCPVQVTHQNSYTRERDDKPMLVRAYFRLLPGGRHNGGCKHAVSDEIKTIASQSDNLFDSIRDGKYRLRLVMIRDALKGTGKNSAGMGSEPGRQTSTVYDSSGSKLSAYINSARRVLKLRALCDGDQEIANQLDLVFEGNTVIPWAQFYFETERYLEAYRQLALTAVQYPIALHGTVKSIKMKVGKNGKSNVLNLTKPRYVDDPANHDIGIGVEASIWCNDPDWFSTLNIGDEVVVLGMWRRQTGKPSASAKPGQYLAVSRTKRNTGLMYSIGR